MPIILPNPRPAYYTMRIRDVEFDVFDLVRAIQKQQQFSFEEASALKYLVRLKDDTKIKRISDLEKAKECIERQIEYLRSNLRVHFLNITGYGEEVQAYKYQGVEYRAECWKGVWFVCQGKSTIGGEEGFFYITSDYQKVSTDDPTAAKFNDKESALAHLLAYLHHKFEGECFDLQSQESFEIWRNELFNKTEQDTIHLPITDYSDTLQAYTHDGVEYLIEFKEGTWYASKKSEEGISIWAEWELYDKIENSPKPRQFDSKDSALAQITYVLGLKYPNKKFLLEYDKQV